MCINSYKYHLLNPSVLFCSVDVHACIRGNTEVYDITMITYKTHAVGRQLA